MKRKSPDSLVPDDVRDRVTASFYAGSAEELARRLLGRLLVRQLADGDLLAVRIVETEAYVGVRDRASHAFGGRRTPRNEAMYAAPGTAYVYFTYGMHFCFNVVCGGINEPVAVLIRAGEPKLGIDRMAEHRRAESSARSPDFETARLCAGPARLCQALAIDRSINGLNLTTDPRVWIAEDRASDLPMDRHVTRVARVGIDFAGAWSARRLRWLIKASPSVSVRPRAGG